jgi:hypothetical protein
MSDVHSCTMAVLIASGCLANGYSSCCEEIHPWGFCHGFADSSNVMDCHCSHSTPFVKCDSYWKVFVVVPVLPRM